MIQAFVYLIGGILLYFIGKESKSGIPPPPSANKKVEKVKKDVESESGDDVRARARGKWMR